jgi:predicted acylesterase/phospholipase RssA
MIPLSFAVAASSALPSLFPPALLRREMLSASVEDFPVSPHLLTDGGVYDNLGFEKAVLAEERGQLVVDLIVVSDAGGPFDWNVSSTFFFGRSRALHVPPTY